MVTRIIIKSKPTYEEESKLVSTGFVKSFDTGELYMKFGQKDEAVGTIDWLMHEFDEFAFEVRTD